MVEFTSPYALSRQQATKAREDAKRRIKLREEESYSPATEAAPAPAVAAPEVVPETSALDMFTRWLQSREGARSLSPTIPGVSPAIGGIGGTDLPSGGSWVIDPAPPAPWGAPPVGTGLQHAPSLRDVLTRVLSGGAEMVGVEDHAAQRFAEKAFQPIDLLTPFGTATSADASESAFERGDVTEGITEGIGAIPYAGKVAGPLAKAGAPALAALFGASSKLWNKHPISSIALRKPLEEMTSGREEITRLLDPRPFSPEQMKVGGSIIGIPGDRTVGGQRLHSVEGQNLTQSVDLLGGEGFTRGAAQQQYGAGWANEAGPAGALENKIAKQKGPTYLWYLPMSQQRERR